MLSRKHKGDPPLPTFASFSEAPGKVFCRCTTFGLSVGQLQSSPVSTNWPCAQSFLASSSCAWHPCSLSSSALDFIDVLQLCGSFFWVCLEDIKQGVLCCWASSLFPTIWSCALMLKALFLQMGRLIVCECFEWSFPCVLQILHVQTLVSITPTINVRRLKVDGIKLRCLLSAARVLGGWVVEFPAFCAERKEFPLVCDGFTAFKNKRTFFFVTKLNPHILSRWRRGLPALPFSSSGEAWGVPAHLTTLWIFLQTFSTFLCLECNLGCCLWNSNTLICHGV